MFFYKHLYKKKISKKGSILFKLQCVFFLYNKDKNVINKMNKSVRFLGQMSYRDGWLCFNIL